MPRLHAVSHAPNPSGVTRAALLLGLTLGAWPALATELRLTATSNGESRVTVAPGAPVVFEVRGVLGDTANEGLAGFAVDISFSGGPLSPADTPATAPMSHFVAPAGVANPAGYGGTLIDGTLVQVGGLQNVIANTAGNAPVPVGAVVTGVAHTSLVLVSGSFVAPLTEDTYTLGLSSVAGAVIRQGETGTPSWAIDLVEPGAITDLTVVVSTAAPAGAIPDGGLVPGEPLRLGMTPEGKIDLSWGPSCLPGDVDYSVYRGVLGVFTSHQPLTCTTDGETAWTDEPGDADSNTYYLVAPTTTFREGSYGVDSDGVERPQTLFACLPRALGSCPGHRSR